MSLTSSPEKATPSTKRTISTPVAKKLMSKRSTSTSSPSPQINSPSSLPPPPSMETQKQVKEDSEIIDLTSPRRTDKMTSFSSASSPLLKKDIDFQHEPELIIPPPSAFPELIQTSVQPTEQEILEQFKMTEKGFEEILDCISVPSNIGIPEQNVQIFSQALANFLSFLEGLPVAPPSQLSPEHEKILKFHEETQGLFVLNREQEETIHLYQQEIEEIKWAARRR